MAFGLRSWLLVVVASCALLAILLLPPSRYPGWFPREPSLERERERVLGWELTRQNELYKRLLWADSVERLVARAEDGLLLGLPATMPADTAAAIRDLVDRVVMQTLRDGSDTVVGYLFLDGSLGAHPQWPRDVSGGSPEYYMGVAGGRPYCVVVLKYHGREPANARSFTRRSTLERVLGPCRFFARYGPPGPAIARWLETGGYALAGARPTTITEPSPLSRGLLGRRPGYTIPSLDGERCVAGHESACAAAVLTPAPMPAPALYGYIPVGLFLMHEGPVAYMPDATTPRPFHGLSRGFLAELEASFGADRFGRFWASEGDMATAFAASFGVPVGPWAMGWAWGEVGVIRAGPGVGWVDVVVSLLAIGALAGMAAVVFGRRGSEGGYSNERG